MNNSWEWERERATEGETSERKARKGETVEFLDNEGDSQIDSESGRERWDSEMYEHTASIKFSNNLPQSPCFSPINNHHNPFPI